ncbi:MAG: efflux RND transporter periplasmic adaptor subunit [Acidobacteriota bacterium]
MASCTLLTACERTREPTDPEPSASLRRGVFEHRLLLSGTLEATERAEVRVPRAAAWRAPIRWMAEEGRQVEKGQPICEFDNQQLLTRLEETELRLLQVQGEYISRRAEGVGELETKHLEVVRRRAASERAALEASVPEHLLARREAQDRKLRLREAELGLEKAVEDLAAAEAALEADLESSRVKIEKTEREVDRVQRRLETLTLHAPRDGLLLISNHPWEGRKLQVGDTSFAGLTVMTIPVLDRMKVDAQLSDVDDGVLAVGQTARCVVDAYPDRSFMGRVSSVSAIAEEARDNSLRRSFAVTITLEENAPDLLIPGMSVRAEVELERRDDALLAPRQALVTADDGRTLFRQEGGELLPVELGPCNALDCLVLENGQDGSGLFARIGDSDGRSG